MSGAEAVVALPDLGDRPGGMAVSGGHMLVTPHRTIAATDVVAWTEHGRLYRLESSGSSVDELRRSPTTWRERGFRGRQRS